MQSMGVLRMEPVIRRGVGTHHMSVKATMKRTVWSGKQSVSVAFSKVLLNPILILVTER